MASIAILNFKKLLPFLYYSSNRHQFGQVCGESDIKCDFHVKIVNLLKFKMVAAAILSFEKLLPFLSYLTNPFQH